MSVFPPRDGRNAKVELLINVFVGTDFPITIAIDGHADWDSKVHRNFASLQRKKAYQVKIRGIHYKLIWKTGGYSPFQNLDPMEKSRGHHIFQHVFKSYLYYIITQA